jgi:putative spermidine/putrescine transport system permease protein
VAARGEDLSTAAATLSPPAERGRAPAALGRLLPWLCIGAFIAFAAAFMLAPTIVLAIQSVSEDGAFTLGYVASLGEYRYRVAFENSLLLSVASATVGVLAGAPIAHAVLKPGAPGWLRAAVTSFAAVAANFAGVPLAFAFISTLGSLGLLTQLLKQAGIDIYALGFSLYSITGLTLTYSYFQVPLMVIIATPAFEALRPSWREAAEGMGASSWQYWRMVGLPVLAPSLLSGWILLFGSAFSAYATAYALTSGNIGLVTTEISNVLSGNVMASPQTGAALSVGMIVVMVGVLLLSALLARRTARWLPQR